MESKVNRMDKRMVLLAFEWKKIQIVKRKIQERQLNVVVRDDEKF